VGGPLLLALLGAAVVAALLSLETWRARAATR